MGKKSRMKKERKEQGSASFAGDIGACHAGHAVLASAKVRAQVQALFPGHGGGNLIVFDGNGVAHGEVEARLMYWTDVMEGIRSRGASCLPEMAGLGRLMNLSLFDVEIPVVEFSSGRWNNEDIFYAMFLLGEVDCFQWLLEEARRVDRDCALLGQVFKRVVENSDRLEVETLHMAIAKMLVRFMAEAFYRHGALEKCMADSESTMGQPFAHLIAQEYLREVANDKERAALDASIVHKKRAAEAGGLRI